MNIEELKQFKNRLSAFADDKPPVCWDLAKDIALAERAIKRHDKVMTELQKTHFTIDDAGKVKVVTRLGPVQLVNGEKGIEKVQAEYEDVYFETPEAEKVYRDAVREANEEQIEVNWHKIPKNKFEKWLEKNGNANYLGALMDIVVVESLDAKKSDADDEEADDEEAAPK